MALSKRLGRLEDRTTAMRLAPEWPPEKMRRAVLDELDFAVHTDSPACVCPEELALLEVESPSDLPEPFRDLVRIEPPTYGMIKKRYENPPEEWIPWREKVRRHRERVRAFVEETRRRDAELAAENRKACGLPPMEIEHGF